MNKHWVLEDEMTREWIEKESLLNPYDYRLLKISKFVKENFGYEASEYYKLMFYHSKLGILLKNLKEMQTEKFELRKSEYFFDSAKVNCKQMDFKEFRKKWYFFYLSKRELKESIKDTIEKYLKINEAHIWKF